MTRKSVACQAIEAGSASRRGLRVVQPVSTMLTHTARSAVPRPVAGGSNRRSIDPPAQRERSWTTDGLLREGGTVPRQEERVKSHGKCQACAWHMETMV